MATQSALHDAIKGQDVLAVQRILRSGTADLEAEVKTSSNFLLRPIHYAVEYGGAETALVIEWLADKGADLNARSRNGFFPVPKDNISALYQAADTNHIAAALALLNRHANPNLMCHGWTPLHRAAECDSPLMVELLVSNGADMRAANPTNGMTPLHSAAYRGAVKACSRLWLLGADLNAKNSNNHTPVEVAVESRREATVAFLTKLTTANVDHTTSMDWGRELVDAIEAGRG